MDDLFGISMNLIMAVLLVLLAISLASVLAVVLRSRVMFLMGLRNLVRRPAQTVLIIIGLMLSTLIISAAFTTGDTVDRSLTSQAFSLMGHTDAWIQRSGEGDSPPREIESTISAESVPQIRAAVDPESNPNIDGFLPILLEQVPVINPSSGQSEPTVNVVGVDATALEGFPDVVSTTTGEELDIGSLAADETYLNEGAADSLATEPGDTVQFFIKGEQFNFTVVDIVEDHVVTGVGDFGFTDGAVIPLERLQEIVGQPGEASFIAISNKGGVRDALDVNDDAIGSIEASLVAAGLIEEFEVYDAKLDLISDVEDAGAFMATFFVIFGLFSIAAGMLLIVMIFVMLAAERKSELGMARAVGTKRLHLIELFLSEGMAYNVLSAAVGAGLGVLLSFAITGILARIFSEFDFNIEAYVHPRSLVISYSLGVVLTFITVTFSSWRVSNLNIVRAIRDIPEPPGAGMSWRWAAVGVIGIALGALLVFSGLQSDLAFPFALGFSILTGCVAVLLRFAGLKDRPVFTTASLFLLIFWGFTAGNRLEFIFGTLEGDIEMFFLSGIAMVTASTFLFVYNADIVLTVIGRLGGLFGAILPAMKTAIAYPLAYKFRTGMTLAMISLVIFALTMMSAMNLNFQNIILADSSRGGWDVIITENPNNPVADLGGTLREAGSDTPDSFGAAGRLGLAGAATVAEAGQDDFSEYPIFGADAGFAQGGTIPLRARARGFESDGAVWNALATRDDVAVVDAFTVTSDGIDFGGEQFSISEIDPDATEFEPVSILLRDSVTGQERQADVIGVIGFGASTNFFGVYIPQQTFEQVFGEPLLSRHFIGLQDPGEAKAVAREIEASLVTIGAQAESLKQLADDQQALFRNFFLLMQGFMGLGLFVGIAAVGVIAFRTVVERRQQIGMLRAIGYKRSTVSLSFIMESSFVTLLGIVSGVGLAVWLSFFLVTSDEFPTSDVGYTIPWLRIAAISAFAFGASLLMTLIPSRQAASIPTAEALRYE